MVTYIVEIKIRKARKEDQDPIINMCKSSMKETYGSFLDEDALKPLETGSSTDRYIKRMINNMVVAHKNEKVVGVLSIDNNLIDFIWVHGDFRGKGIGKTLMHKAENHLKTKGYKKARLECYEPNKRSIKFYKNLDWIPKSSEYDKKARVNRILMEKSIV